MISEHCSPTFWLIHQSGIPFKRFICPKADSWVFHNSFLLLKKGTKYENNERIISNTYQNTSKSSISVRWCWIIASISEIFSVRPSFCAWILCILRPTLRIWSKLQDKRLFTVCRYAATPTCWCGKIQFWWSNICL